MEEILKIITHNGLTPNQMFLLFSIQDGVSMPLISLKYELSVLKDNKWVNEENVLQPKAVDLIKEIDGFIKKSKKKTDKVVMGDNFLENIAKYNQMYPARKLNTGKYARSAERNLLDPFRWFFDNTDYTWDEVFKATAAYLDTKERDNWDYTINSQYFIRKQNNDKSWKSELADYCQNIRDGVDDFTVENYFKENIFKPNS
ncbi:MAG TPA: hypothetical protein PLG47_05185 [Candidatus Dojkabacteria bacterium]|nr:hypothetical protein [Candidatus Dojkabacteria bacterium]